MFNDIFAIENPDEYSCVVHKYVLSHSVLHLEVKNKSRPPDLFYVAFCPVEYFAGPIVWQSAYFKIASEDEALSILRQLERYQHLAPEQLLESPYNLKLFTVETPINSVKIVASEAKMRREAWII